MTQAAQAAKKLLVATWGDDRETATGWAPGRTTIVGEHIDYVGGLVVACALPIGIEVAVRASADAQFRVVSGSEQCVRATVQPCGDIGDRILGGIAALQRA